MKKLTSNYTYLPMLVAGKKNVLDYGCGRGDLLVQLRKVVPDSIGCDISDFIYAGSPVLLPELEVNESIFRVREDGTNFDSEKFDCIISNQVMEHVFDHWKILTEMDRLLAPKGQLVLCFPTEEIIVEPHLKLPFIHRIKRFPLALETYLSIAHFLKIGQAKRSKGTRREWVKERSNYLYKNTNYIKAKDFQNLLVRLGFQYEDLSHKILEDRFELNWVERVFFRLIGARRVTGLLLVCSRK